jgi:tRNA G18 (ribose-2'-O)-methylase SpoU
MTEPTIVPITDLSNPALEPYRDQKDAWLRARHNPEAQGSTTGTGLDSSLFMAEGELVFEQLLESRHQVVSVLVSENRLAGLEPLLGRLEPGVPVFVGPSDLLERVLGFRMHRGLLACGQAAAPMTESELIAGVRTIVALEDLANHDNVGGIFRCVRALAGTGAGVLLSPRCCDPLYRRALRVSIGHALHVPWAWAQDWPGALDRVRGGGFRVLAMTPGEGAADVRTFAGTANRGVSVCVLVGAEGPGLTEDAMDRATDRVRIAMDSAVDSLNVTVSVALSLHTLGAIAGT